MKNTAKRLLALLLAMAMSLSLLSTNVWATDLTGDDTPGQTEVQEASEEAPEEATGEASEEAPEEQPGEASEEGSEEQPGDASEEASEEQPKDELKAQDSKSLEFYYPTDGYYDIMGLNGNGEGQWIELHKSVKEAEKQVYWSRFYIYWVIRREGNGYTIRWIYDESFRLGTNKLEKKTDVYCSNGDLKYDKFVFVKETDKEGHSGVSIRFADDTNYRLNRHKELKVLGPDEFYLNANKDNDTNNKLWELQQGHYSITYRYSYIRPVPSPWGSRLPQGYQEQWGQSVPFAPNPWNILESIPEPNGDEILRYGDPVFLGWTHIEKGGRAEYKPGQLMTEDLPVKNLTNYRSAYLYGVWGTRPNSTVNCNLTASSVSARSNGKATVKWAGLRKKLKGSKLWEATQAIEIQCSRNSKFTSGVKTKIVMKGSIDKNKAKTTLSKLKKNKTYYVRIRLIGKEGTYSRWSRVLKFKTKK